MLRSFPPYGSATALALLLAGCGSGTADRVTPLPLELTSAPLLFQNADFRNDANGVPTLNVILPSPSAGEQIAVFLMNVGGQDRGTATMSVSGTAPLPLVVPSPLLAEGAPEATLGVDVWTAHEAVRRRNEATIAEFLSRGGTAALAQRSAALVAAATAPQDPAIFCVTSLSGSAAPRTATLKAESPHALFYVDRQDLSMYAPYEAAGTPGGTIWNRLADAWETNIYPSDTSLFGQPSDVDQNGKLIILFSSAVDDPTINGIVLGYYSASDVFYPADSRNCTGTGSNGADMFYLNALGTLVTDTASSTQPRTADYIVNVMYPSTLAHEFQHLINFNQHCFVHSRCADSEIWVNEGLSMVAEDQAGYGWHPVTYTRFDGTTSPLETDVSSAKLYLTQTRKITMSDGSPSPYRGFDTASITIWETPGDPIGNYEGVHSWFRYFTDRLGTGFLSQLATGDLAGIPNFERAAGMTFSQGLADFTRAMMFSNEDFSTSATPLDFTRSDTFDLTGLDWTPFHTKLRHLDYGSLNPGAPTTVWLRQNGWNAFLTGKVPAGLTSPVTVTVTSGTVTPWVAVARFTGTLPSK